MKKLYTSASLYLFFAICWLTYFSTYLGRLNFTASIAEIQLADHLSKTALGQVASVFLLPMVWASFAAVSWQTVFPLICWWAAGCWDRRYSMRVWR